MKFLILLALFVLSVSSVKGDCPEGFTQWTDSNGNSFGYKVVLSKSVNINQAKPLCKQLGADIASIHSQEENEFITTNIQEINGKSIWIGTYIVSQDDGSLKSLFADKSDVSYGTYSNTDERAAPWNTDNVGPSFDEGSTINCAKLESNQWSETQCYDRLDGILCKTSC